jgi:hypothetical protein
MALHLRLQSVKASAYRKFSGVSGWRANWLPSTHTSLPDDFDRHDDPPSSGPPRQRRHDLRPRCGMRRPAPADGRRWCGPATTPRSRWDGVPLWYARDHGQNLWGQCDVGSYGTGRSPEGVVWGQRGSGSTRGAGVPSRVSPQHPHPRFQDTISPPGKACLSFRLPSLDGGLHRDTTPSPARLDHAYVGTISRPRKSMPFSRSSPHERLAPP